MSESNDLNLLLVEDNEIDVIAFKRGLDKHRISNRLYVARNGVEALQMLRGEDGRDTIPRPYVIFLDLNMPIMNGIECLEAIRQDPALEMSIVFVLTTSLYERDVIQAYKKHIAGYIPKQNLDNAWASIFEMIDAYQQIVVIPKH